MALPKGGSQLSRAATTGKMPMKNGRAPLVTLNGNIYGASPPSVLITEASRRRETAQRRKRLRCPSWLSSEHTSLVCQSTVVLLAAMGERVGFKISIDQMEPFRVFLALCVVLVTVLTSAAIVMYKKAYTSDITRAMHYFPRRDILLVALLDTLQLYLMVIAGASTPPVLTVLSMQASLPLVWLISRVVGRAGAPFAWQHAAGAVLILGGIATAVVPTVRAAISDGQNDIAINTLVFLSCTVPLAISQVVKEDAVVRFGQPMDMHYLNLLLALYQALLLLMLLPLAYRAQGLGESWGAYANADLGSALSDLWLCLFTKKGAIVDDYKYPVKPECAFAQRSTAAYVLCTPLVTATAHAVLDKGSSTLLYRLLNGGVGMAFVFLALYSADGWGWQAVGLNLGDLLGGAMVMLGLELFCKQPEPYTEILTEWSPV